MRGVLVFSGTTRSLNLGSYPTVDMRVLDVEGHRTFLDFSRRELGAAFVYEAEDAVRTAAA